MAWKPTKRALAKLAGRMLTRKAKGAALYAEAGRIEEELARHMKPGDDLKLADGVVVKMIDPFVDKDGEPCRAWKHTPINRYEFKVATPTPKPED